jgi:hypothetical protein
MEATVSKPYICGMSIRGGETVWARRPRPGDDPEQFVHCGPRREAEAVPGALAWCPGWVFAAGSTPEAARKDCLRKRALRRRQESFQVRPANSPWWWGTITGTAFVALCDAAKARQQRWEAETREMMKREARKDRDTRARMETSTCVSTSS